MSLCDSCDVLISLIPFFQNGEAVDFESQSIYVNCDGDSAGIDFGLELVGIDLNDAATLTTVRNTLRNTVLIFIILRRLCDILIEFYSEAHFRQFAAVYRLCMIIGCFRDNPGSFKFWTHYFVP